MMALYAEMEKAAIRARPRVRRRRPLVLPMWRMPPAQARVTIICSHLDGSTCLRRGFSAAPTTLSRGPTSRRAWRQRQRPVNGMQAASIQGMGRGDGVHARARQEPQFVGEVIRLGRTMPSMRGPRWLGGYRPRQFEGKVLCLGRGGPMGKAQLRVVSRAAMPTLPFRYATTPSAWRRRVNARAVACRAPPRPSGWRRCGGELRPA